MNSKPMPPVTPVPSAGQRHPPEGEEGVLESLGEAVTAPIFGADEVEPGEPKDRRPARDRS